MILSSRSRLAPGAGRRALNEKELKDVTGGSADGPLYSFEYGMCYEDLETPCTVYRVRADYANVPGDVWVPVDVYRHLAFEDNGKVRAEDLGRCRELGVDFVI